MRYVQTNRQWNKSGTNQFHSQDIHPLRGTLDEAKYHLEYQSMGEVELVVNDSFNTLRIINA